MRSSRSRGQGQDKTVNVRQAGQGGSAAWWKAESRPRACAHETQQVVTQTDGTKYINGAPASNDNQLGWWAT